MVSEAIYRHEYKYYINACDSELLARRLGTVLERDKHAGPDGTYVIRSLYFDNFDDQALLEKINGSNPRSKFRIRIYNWEDKIINLEKKVKVGELTQKLQAKLTREQVDQIVAGDIDWMRDDGRGVVAELYAKMRTYSLRPKVLVEYTRTPFVYFAGNVRVTIDRDIRTGIFSDDLFEKKPLVPSGSVDVLEVKYDRFLPDIVKQIITPFGRDRQSLSKYEACRIYG